MDDAKFSASGLLQFQNVTVLVELIKKLYQLELPAYVYLVQLTEKFFFFVLFQDVTLKTQTSEYDHCHRFLRLLLSNLMVFKTTTFESQDYTSKCRINTDVIDGKRNQLKSHDHPITLRDKNVAIGHFIYITQLINIINEFGYCNVDLIKRFGQSVNEIMENESKDIKFEALINNIMESLFLFKLSVEKKAQNVV